MIHISEAIKDWVSKWWKTNWGKSKNGLKIRIGCGKRGHITLILCNVCGEGYCGECNTKCPGESHLNYPLDK